MTSWRAVLLIVVVLAAGARACGQDAFFRVLCSQLTVEDGAWPPAPPEGGAWQWGLELPQPYAILDGPGEVYVMHAGEETGAQREWWQRDWAAGETILIARAPGGQRLTGRLFVPDPLKEQLVALRFSLGADAAADSRRAFYLGKALHYERLQAGDYAGTAWFRHQAAEARRELGAGDSANPRRTAIIGGQLDDTYDLFTGGRAVSENLQLHRDLPQATPAEPAPAEVMVPVDSIEGVTVRELDWSARLIGTAPALDPLASAIPADQHAVFFPGFEALASLLAEVNDDGLPIFRSVMPRSEDGGILARYERQLCLSTRGLARLLGPLAVKSVAVTGSDPYVPTGTDVAVVFESSNPAALAGVLLAQIRAAAGAAGAPAGGDAGGVRYEGVATPDRVVSSYVATIGSAVVVSNSVAQLARLGAVAGGRAPHLAGLPEYRFFRTRYPLGADGETAFVFLSDATIRRWCGARWRIGASRRLRAAALLADVTAAYMDELVAGVATVREVRADVPMRTIGALSLGAGGVSSAVYGSLRFITPIAELDLDQVTKDEEAAYARWRTGYQRNWSWAFDPIGLSIRLNPTRAGADMTIMPLIAGSEYRQWMSIAQGAAIAPDAGDPHASIIHGALAVNVEAPVLKQWAGFARTMAPQIEVDPLGWLGQSIALYADPDPFWGELPAAEKRDEFMQANAWRLPVALYAEVSSPLKLTAFVASARAFIEQSAPGMAAWEPREHSGQAYVKVGMSEQARAEARGDPMDQVAVYYAAMPRALILSLSEDVLKRAIEREQGRRPGAQNADKADGAAERPWLGSSLCLRFDAAGLSLLEQYNNANDRHAGLGPSWSNLPILNEWKRRYPDKDPVALHRTVWGSTLMCPAGGTYQWNEAFATMASSVCGHPGEPPAEPVRPPGFTGISAADFGLTFEQDGLRARAEVTRTPKR